MEQLGQFITHHWLLWSLFIAILLLIFLNELMTQKKKTAEISAQKAVDLMNNEQATIIDLRNKDAFAKGHIIDAIHIDANALTADKLKQYKKNPLILVCERGVQSATAASALQAQGFTLYVLRGGISAWQNASLPLVKGKI